MRDAIMFLQSKNITLNMALKIYKKYGEDTQAKVMTNPYMLIEDIDGIGFISADKIAASSGIKKDSVFRIQAGLIYTLKEAAEKHGNTFLPKSELVENAAKLLSLDAEFISGDVEVLSIARKVRYIEFENSSGEIDQGVMLSAIYSVEKTAGNSLANMLVYANALHIDVEEEINLFEKRDNIKLHGAQRDAVASAVNSGVSVITGGPGTGKTTIIKCILSILMRESDRPLVNRPLC